MTSARLLLVFPVLASLGLAGCSTFGFGGSSSTPAAPQGESGGNVFRNLLLYGGTTVPPSMKIEKEMECPSAFIRDGGAVIRNGKGQAVSSQLTIRNVDRECVPDGDGVIVKVGIEGLALIGAAGKPGPVSGALTITADRDGKVVASRASVAKVTIGAEGQALFTVIEDGIRIPPGEGDTVINVGFKN